MLNHINELKYLPYYNLTNIELLDINVTSHSKFKDFYRSHNFTNTLKGSLPDDISQLVNCKYYHIDNFNQTFFKKCPKFTLFHHNIRSLNKHRTELQGFLECLNIDFNVIALTETGKTNNQQQAAFFKNYNYYADPASCNFGGAGLLVHNDIEVVSVRDDLRLPCTSESDTNYLVENKWIELKMPNMKKMS